MGLEVNSVRFAEGRRFDFRKKPMVLLGWRTLTFRNGCANSKNPPSFCGCPITRADGTIVICRGLEARFFFRPALPNASRRIFLRKR